LKCVEGENSEGAVQREPQPQAESGAAAKRLVHPGAAVETRTVSHRYRLLSARPKDANVGGTAEGMAFRPKCLG